MRVIKKVIEVGGSIGITIDKLVLEDMKISVGDVIVVDIVRKVRRKKE